MTVNGNLKTYGLQEAFLTMPVGENLNLASPGYFFAFDALVRNTIKGFTWPNPTELSLPAGVFWLTTNLILDIVTAAGTSARFGMYYNVEIGGVIQSTPATYSYVTDSTDTGFFGDAFVFPISLAVPSIVRLNSVRNRGGVGAINTEVGCSVGIIKVA